MDFSRINKDLKKSIDSFPFSLEINEAEFLNNPEIIQQEKQTFAKENPFKGPDNVTVKDIFIKSSLDDHQIRLHIYQPEEFDKNRTIIYFHGGGYVFGLPEQVDDQMFDMAQNLRATIISVDYRLSPQYKFPVPVTDGFDSLQWAISHGAEHLGIDPENIAVFGASAGGHLAAAVTQMANDKGIRNIKHQFLLYPVIHNKLDTFSMNEFTDAPLWNKKNAEIAWLHFLGDENAGKSIKYADLTNYSDFSGLPRTTVVACELDPLRDENIEYSQLLYRAGVETELWVIPGALHVFDLFDSPLKGRYREFLYSRMF
ncbi:alpha/beta hydrolase [Chryseobacterium shigense]|uniref:Acetyl esterase/lipase n=1 Tax=Chryseobacterium shigense TaxID=297244 RepID=A0A841N0R8_9FLAO|nr:alpha/beta hydrolase [Chryseobacterium shigense]MBB6370756.1 acetyl esterase/lipase [Chryseobacterium shigense]